MLASHIGLSPKEWLEARRKRGDDWDEIQDVLDMLRPLQAQPVSSNLGDALDRARKDNAALFSNVDADLPAPGAPLSDWEAGEGVGPVEAVPASNVPDQLRALLNDGESIRDAKPRLWPLLNSELEDLRNQEALFNRTIPRRAEVEDLIGILARLGEG